MSLEVDARQHNQLLTNRDDDAHFKNAPEPYGHAAPGSYYNVEKVQSSIPQSNVHRICGVRMTTLALSTALAVVSVLAVIAAAVGGSLAVRHQNNYETCTDNLHQLETSGNSCPNPSTNSSATNLNNNPDTFQSTTNCTSLNSPYPAEWGYSTYNLDCGKDYPSQKDLMGINAYTFAACVTACSSYNERRPDLHQNSTCYGVSYYIASVNAVGYGQGNCWLKSEQNIKPVAKSGVVDSALVNVQSIPHYAGGG